MWSFEGDHRRRPNVNLGGASKLLDSKTAFLEKLRKERESRELNKRKENAATKIQAFIRGFLCRLHTSNQCRRVYDDLLHSAPSPLTQPATRTLCLKMLHLFRRRHDTHRLVSLCTLLVRNNTLLLEWSLKEPQIWTNVLAQLLYLALDVVASPAEKDGEDQSNSPRHAGPLRLLELMTQPQQLPIGTTQHQHAAYAFSLITKLIKTGYFHQIITILIRKVPPVDEKTCHSSFPLASSLLNILMYPIYLVATCRRPSELWDAATVSEISFPFMTSLKASKKSSQSSAATYLPADNRKTDVAKATAAVGVEPMDEGSNSSTESNTLAKSIGEISVISGTNIGGRRKNLQQGGKKGKSQREEDGDEGERVKLLRVSEPEEQQDDSLLFSASPSITPVATTQSSCSTEPGGKLITYAFGDIPIEVPSNFINLTLYNLIKEMFSCSRASQVYNFLAPCIENSKLLTLHPTATHVLIQSMYMLLADKSSDKSIIKPGSAGATSGKEDDVTADASAAAGLDTPAKLSILLMLVPIKTSLTTTSLQLYILLCQKLVKTTLSFFPAHKQIETNAEGEANVESDSDDYDSEDEGDYMDVDTKVQLKPSQPIIEVGDWCIRHINSAEYVSWLLDEMESSKLDQEVLTAFCSLSHTLLVAPCLTLFQCRLVYGVVGRYKMQRAIWELLNSLYPSWVTAPSSSRDKSGRGTVKLIDAVTRGVPLEPGDRDILVPVLASFVTATLAVLATLHDSELVTQPLNSIEELFKKSDQEESYASSSFPFSVSELIVISGTLKDVCVGLAELAYPDTRAASSTDITYKPIWDHCFKSCVDVVRQLHLRDTRRKFCPVGHWLTSRVSLPDLPHTATYKALLNNRLSGRQRTFMPTTWKTRAKLLEEAESGDNTIIGRYERIRATVLQELPFVFSFTDRAEVFLRLVYEDRCLAQRNSNFNSGQTISIKVRRTHLFEDAMEKLSQKNEGNLRYALRVSMINAAGMLEAGVDGGGLFREFLADLLMACFDPNRGFFLLTRENTLYPNPAAHLIHGDIFKFYYFIGRMLGKALYEKLLVEIPLAGFFLSKLLSRKGYSIEFHHLDSLDPELCRNLMYLKTHKGDVQDLNLDFSVITSELGKNRVVELIPDGANIPVTADNKIEYIYRMADFKLNKQIAKQCYAFNKGLNDVVPAEWLQLFDWRELQTMISGAPSPVNIADLRDNTHYNGEYDINHNTIQLFWQVVEQFNEHQRRLLLKFVTSCSRPPLLGFKDLLPAFCIHPSGSDERLPSAATCMNLLKLPKYSDPITLREKLLYAITSNAGFELS